MAGYMILKGLLASKCNVCGTDRVGGLCLPCHRFFRRSIRSGNHLSYRCIKSFESEDNRALAGDKEAPPKRAKKLFAEDLVKSEPGQVESMPSSSIHQVTEDKHEDESEDSKVINDRDSERLGCAVTSENRNKCKKCRFQGCLDTGLSLEDLKVETTKRKAEPFLASRTGHSCYEPEGVGLLEHRATKRLKCETSQIRQIYLADLIDAREPDGVFDVKLEPESEGEPTCSIVDEPLDLDFFDAIMATNYLDILNENNSNEISIDL